MLSTRSRCGPSDNQPPGVGTRPSAACHRRLLRGLVVGIGSLLSIVGLHGEPVTVRHPEGITHGFLALRTLEGATIADGDLVQDQRGAPVTTRLTFHFRDGSLHDETAVFSQRARFRLVSDHLVQKGPSFPHPLDMSIDAVTGVVRVRYSEDGKQEEDSEHVDIPPDLANGLVLTLLKNVNPAAPPKSFSFVVATPKPRLIKLRVTAGGEDRFRTGSRHRAATRYVLKPEIGGLGGLLAPLVGKQPPDSNVWILGGVAPTFVKSEQQLFIGGPVWRIELVAPAWREGTRSP